MLLKGVDSVNDFELAGFLLWSAATGRRFALAPEAGIEISRESKVRSKRRRVAALQIR